MKFPFDETQETYEEYLRRTCDEFVNLHEEYLRRIHLEYKLGNRVEIDEKEEAQEAKNKSST